MPVTDIEAGVMMEIKGMAGLNGTKKYAVAGCPEPSKESPGVDQVFNQILSILLNYSFPFLQEEKAHCSEAGQNPVLQRTLMPARAPAPVVFEKTGGRNLYPGAGELSPAIDVPAVDLSWVRSDPASCEGLFPVQSVTWQGGPLTAQASDGTVAEGTPRLPQVLTEKAFSTNPATWPEMRLDEAPAPERLPVAVVNKGELPLFLVAEVPETVEFVLSKAEKVILPGASGGGLNECTGRQEALKSEPVLALTSEENSEENLVAALQTVKMKELPANGCCGSIMPHSAAVAKGPEQAGVRPGSLLGQVIEPVVIQVQNMISRNRQKAGLQLQLSPARMGELTIKLSLEKGFLTAHFYTGNDTVKDTLEASFGCLREVLAFHQLRLQEAAVFLTDGGVGGNNQGLYDHLNRSCSRGEAVSFSGSDNQAEERGGLRKEKSSMVDYLI